jgi:predicted RNA-binding Zn-ribbon protein involved in translation (DUF1610 family)
MRPSAPISGTWSNPAARRCDSKHAYFKMSPAESNANRATKRTGELIVAYECPDCGRFHIGHADLAERLAREVHVDFPCLQCGGVIPEFKKLRAAQWQAQALYCSNVCQTQAASARKRARDATKVIGSNNE